MGGEAEAAGDVLTGSIVAGAIEGSAALPPKSASHDPCRNCGTLLDGRYCSACGQPAHLHRSLLSLGHDILHAVFHFEGKIWRTIPELFFHPGRLTRRYIAGERAKFVSPMALFLFTVFLMFAVFSFTGGVLMERGESTAGGADTDVTAFAPGDWRSAVRESIKETDSEIESRRQELKEDDLSPTRRAKLEGEISELQTGREAMDAVAKGDWSKLAVLESKSDSAATPGTTAEGSNAGSNATQKESANKVQLGWPALDNRLTEGLNGLNNNPQLLLYKMKVNAYKFSWALIPLSVPFLWLMFFWRRDIHLYDHAIFVTYSISFVMLFLILLSIGSSFVSSGWWEAALMLVPIHLYKQLRGAYRISRTGAFVRLFFLQISIGIVVALFSSLLLVFGVLD